MIFRGPYSEVSIPDVPLTQLVLRRAQALGNKPALIEGPTGRIITYSQLADASHQVAAGLASGDSKRETSLNLSPNVPEYAIIFHAVASLGGINTPSILSTRSRGAHQLKDAAPDFS